MTDQIPQEPLVSLVAIQSFLDGYGNFVSKEKGGTLGDVYKNFDRIRDHLKSLKQQTLAEGLAAAPEFNVFHLLGLSRAEVRTHSAMLAHLFRPGETHGQRLIFLQSFLEYCHSKQPAFPLPSGDLENAHWDVYTEYVTASDGRMDVVIRSPDLGYIVVVENKVDAWEQTDQLKRYSRWLESQSRDYPVQGMIFLTLDGSRAYTADSAFYLSLSYHDDIYSWLVDNLDRIQAPNVSAIISQYATLVRNL